MDACYVRQTTAKTKLEDLEPGDTFIVEAMEHNGSPSVWIVTDYEPSGGVMCVLLATGRRQDMDASTRVIEVKPEGQVKFMQVRG